MCIRDSACVQAARGDLGPLQVKSSAAASACVVVASEGYPNDPKVGKEIAGLQAAGKIPGAIIFHAGTRREGEKYYTTGGRVLSVGASGENLAAACKIAYEAVSKIRIDGAHYRRDIGSPKVAGKAAAESPNG